MSGRDPIARLIPWYAAGTLEAAESEQVESHLASCDECRDLLAVARGFRRLAPETPIETLFDHVQSQRLVEFAADPAVLEPEARRFITSHIQACTVCAEALEILEDLGRAPAADEGGGTMRSGAAPPIGRLWQACREVWRRLSRTILRPGPALVYLTALVVVLAVVPLRPPPPGSGPPPGLAVPGPEPTQPQAPVRPPASFVPPVFDLPGEVVFRGRAAPPSPLVVPLRPGADTVALSLVTDIDSDDLEDGSASFRVEIHQGDRLVFEAPIAAGDIDRRGRVMLLVDPAALAAGVQCRARLLLVKPGDPRDGEELYQRSFLLAPSRP